MQIHIGKIIEKVFNESSLTVVELAKKMGCARNTIYKNFDKKTLDSGLIQDFSKALNHDFFKYYSEESNSINGPATKADITEVLNAITRLSKKKK